LLLVCLLVTLLPCVCPFIHLFGCQ
jgi:hypothetical protein